MKYTKALNEAITKADNYSYMAVDNRHKDDRTAFDKYIELAKVHIELAKIYIELQKLEK